MKEPYGEGVANHTDPESCVGLPRGGGEALTGARAGQVLSREIPKTQGADAVLRVGRQHRSVASARRSRALRGQRPWARTGSTSHGNRESPSSPSSSYRARRPYREV